MDTSSHMSDFAHTDIFQYAQDPARRVRSQGGVQYEYMAATIRIGPNPPNDGNVWKETSLLPLKEGEPFTLPNGMTITRTVTVRLRILMSRCEPHCDGCSTGRPCVMTARPECGTSSLDKSRSHACLHALATVDAAVCMRNSQLVSVPERGPVSTPEYCTVIHTFVCNGSTAVPRQWQLSQICVADTSARALEHSALLCRRGSVRMNLLATEAHHVQHSMMHSCVLEAFLLKSEDSTEQQCKRQCIQPHLPCGKPQECQCSPSTDASNSKTLAVGHVTSPRW